MTPRISANHRYGRVFVRLVYMSRLGRVSRMTILSPAEARKLGEELIDLAARAEGRHKSLKMKKG